MPSISCAWIAHWPLMGPAFQQVYSLLPGLLHYHHPLMPGYLDGNVPCGICLYTPDETQQPLPETSLKSVAGCRNCGHRTVNCRLPAFTPWAAPRRSGRAVRRTLISGFATSPGWITKSASCCSVNVACWKAGPPRWGWKSAFSD
jgi:hypothetical protein